MSIFSRAFWTAAAERALKTGAQSALLVFGADQINVLSVSWVEVGGFAAGGVVLSLLTSVASNRLGDGAGPSLANEYAVPREVG